MASGDGRGWLKAVEVASGGEQRAGSGGRREVRQRKGRGGRIVSAQGCWGGGVVASSNARGRRSSVTV